MEFYIPTLIMRRIKYRLKLLIHGAMGKREHIPCKNKLYNTMQSIGYNFTKINPTS